SRLGEVALRELARALRRPSTALGVLEPVGPEAELAGAAVDQGVAEPRDMPGRLPDRWIEDHRGVDCDDVVALLHHRPEPQRTNVVLHQHAVVAVVVCRADAAVDLRGREDESAAPAERDDLVHGHVGHRAVPYPAWRQHPRSERWRKRASVSLSTSTSTTRRAPPTVPRPQTSSTSTPRGSSRRSS